MAFISLGIPCRRDSCDLSLVMLMGSIRPIIAKWALSPRTVCVCFLGRGGGGGGGGGWKGVDRQRETETESHTDNPRQRGAES